MTWADEHARSVAALLDEDFALGEVIGSLARVVDHRTRAFVALVAVRPDSKDRLSTRHHGAMRLHTHSETKKVRVMTIELTAPRFENYPSIPIRIEKLNDGPVAVMLSVCPTAAWREAFTRLMAAAAPRFYFPFLRQGELRTIFEALEGALPKDEELRLVRLSGLRRLSEGTSRKSFQSQVEWPDLPFRTAFDRAKEDSSFFRRAAFRACKREVGRETGLTGGLTNFAEFSANDNLTWLYESGVRVAVEMIERQFELARERARTDDDRASPKALAADFTEVNITRDKLPGVTARFRRMPRASVSILHGNPYLHASIVDLTDGSIFDFVLVSSSRALILPQGRATEGAVTRLCKFIYEQIGEAEFRDASDSRHLEAST